MKYPKLTLFAVAACVAMVAFSPNAHALTFNDTHVVGTVSPGAPANPGSVKDYINFMITLMNGQSVTHNFGQPEGSQTITRSNNNFASLPQAVAAGAVTGSGTTINLGAGGVFTYLFAKYDGQNDLSFVWNVAGMSGTITIPALGPMGHGLSGWILFPGGGQGVPDGGTTVMLLGAALGALGMARRYLRI
jgi:VPDSG-CTERM motif